MSKRLSRRVVLGGAVAGIATMSATALALRGEGEKGALSGQAESVQPPSADRPTPQVPKRMLGKTGKEIPILLLGTGMGIDRRFDPKLAEALEFGANYIDAADCYDEGRCEASVASFHKRVGRDRVWITSKSDEHDPEGFSATLDRSLAQLETDHIDLYFLHKLTDPAMLSDALHVKVEAAKAAGKILHFGFSCHGPNVPELLDKAAQTPWVEAVMFRYNFRKYGDEVLSAAMDRAHAAGVGLIAMKTQASEASFEEHWRKYHETGRWSKHQAVLHAVWADKRITAICSGMETLSQQRENIAAALDPGSLGAAEWESLHRYAAATRSVACDGCDHLCGAAAPEQVRIGDTLRYLMYYDAYRQSDEARALFAKLPAAARQLTGIDFGPATEACPHGVDVAGLMKRASRVLA